MRLSVPAARASPAADELHMHRKTDIAGYKAPRTIELVDRLPLSGHGRYSSVICAPSTGPPVTEPYSESVERKRPVPILYDRRQSVLSGHCRAGCPS